jgi:hypothetical protein
VPVAHMMIKSCLMHSFRSSGSIFRFRLNGIRPGVFPLASLLMLRSKAALSLMLLWSHGRVARLSPRFQFERVDCARPFHG